MDDEELSEKKKDSIVRFKRAIKRFVVIKRFASKMGIKIDAMNIEIAKLTMK